MDRRILRLGGGLSIRGRCASGGVRQKFDALPIYGIYFYVADHFGDREMVGYPYPFSFGRN